MKTGHKVATAEEVLVTKGKNLVANATDTVAMSSPFITGAQPKAGTGLKMQTVRFFNVTLLGIYRCLRYIAGSLKSYPPF